jgi:tetratricopeptide (TPR) repeat protein
MTLKPTDPVKPDTESLQQLEAIIKRIASDPGGASADAEAFLKAHSDFPPAWRIAALAVRQNKRDAEADQLELKGIAVALDRPRLKDALQAFNEGRLPDAEAAVRSYLREDPEDPAAALILGAIAARCGAPQQAETLYRRALLLAPAYAEAGMALALLLRESSRYDEALTAAQSILVRDPRHLPALSLVAALLMQVRRLEESEAAFDRMLTEHPDDSRGWMNYGFLLKAIGRQEDAVAAYRRAVTISPANGQAWFGLANLKTVRLSSADITAMSNALKNDKLDFEERLHLYFALGKALDDTGDHAAAFAAFSEGARIRLARAPHDPDAVFDNVRSAERTFTSSFYSERDGWGSQARDPIFIVSLPRSGSTLIEQILASHPMIEGTEELHNIEALAIALADQRNGIDYTQRIGSLDERQVRELGELYVAATRNHRHTDRPFFTDKMPGNWMYLGLIRLIFPNAKVIDVRRHPMACGFANFTQHFHQGINFSYDLGHIGQFYTSYVRQIAHFDSVAPGYVHRVFHEALIDDLEGEVRRLLDYLELPFDKACLRFFENKRAVHTPSSEQVRQPIYREGMSRWLPYRSWLGPLEEALGPVLTCYPTVPPLRDEPPQGS